MTIMYDSNSNAIGDENPLPVRQIQSDIIIPVDIQKRYAETIQTHNAVSVAINSWSIESTWHSCDGFYMIAGSLVDDGNFANGLVVYWSYDGSTVHGQDTLIGIGVRQNGSGIIDIKAPYFKFSLGNTETGAAHIMSAWAYLKA